MLLCGTYTKLISKVQKIKNGVLISVAFATCSDEDNLAEILGKNW